MDYCNLLLRNEKNAFTLIELLVVILIITLLAGAMVPMFQKATSDARKAKATADINAIKSACYMFHIDTGKWPPPCKNGLLYNDGDCLGSPIPGWNGPYLDEWKKDPWGTDYLVVFHGPLPDHPTSFITAESAGPNGIGPEVSPDYPGIGGDDIGIVITPDITK